MKSAKKLCSCIRTNAFVPTHSVRVRARVCTQDRACLCVRTCVSTNACAHARCIFGLSQFSWFYLKMWNVTQEGGKVERCGIEGFLLSFFVPVIKKLNIITLQSNL